MQDTSERQAELAAAEAMNAEPIARDVRYREGNSKALFTWDDAVVEQALGEEWRGSIRELREALDMDPYVRGTELPEELSWSPNGNSPMG